MKIVDLSYLENIQASRLIVGGASVGVEAYASATGDSTLAVTETEAQAKELPSGGSIARGTGTATAIGDDTTASVSVYGEGDIVIGKTQTKEFENKDMTVAKGFVIAVDTP